MLGRVLDRARAGFLVGCGFGGRAPLTRLAFVTAAGQGQGGRAFFFPKGTIDGQEGITLLLHDRKTCSRFPH